MNVGSLFSGIGGFDLGLERAGFKTSWFCEQDPFCRRVLDKHWPGVPCYADVRRIGAGIVEPVEVLAGGFPCQDLSVAGKGAGLDGERSGLWSEYARLIGELRPRYVIVENVPALLARGFGRVLGDLAALGYDAEWDCIPASAFGAPHRRDRVWIVAYPQSIGQRESADETNAKSDRRNARTLVGSGGLRGGTDEGRPLHDTLRGRHGAPQGQVRPGWNAPLGSGGGEAESFMGGVVDGISPWLDEPDIPRVATGVPDRVDRLRALGNALIPQIATWIGSRVMAYEQQTNPVRW